jgi:hypothetical protein
MQQDGNTRVRKTFPQLPGGTVKNPKFIQTKQGNKLLIDGWWAYARKPVSFFHCCDGIRLIHYLLPNAELHGRLHSSHDLEFVSAIRFYHNILHPADSHLFCEPDAPASSHPSYTTIHSSSSLCSYIEPHVISKGERELVVMFWISLIYRLFRCHRKYGKDWEGEYRPCLLFFDTALTSLSAEYMRVVPYKFIPGIY